MSNIDDLLSASFSDFSFDTTETPTQGPLSVSSIPQEHVIVFVRSNTFTILPSLFEQVKGLPWCESGGYNHLNAEPGHFEVIVQFFLEGAFPGRVVVKQNKPALSKLVSYLGKDAEELKICIEQGGGGRKGRNGLRMKRRGSNSSNGSAKALSRNSSNGSLGSVKKLLQSPFSRSKKKLSTDELLESAISKLANAHISDDASDLGSEITSSIDSYGSENPRLSRHLDKQSYIKTLHQEWCQSEYIV